MAEPIETEPTTADDTSEEEVEDPKAVLAANRKLNSENKNLRARLKKIEKEQEQAREAAMTDQEKAIQAAVDAALAEERAKSQGKLVAAAARAAAADLLADPEDAVQFIDLSDFDPDDTEALTAAVKELIKLKPYLAKAPTRRTPDIDQGPVGDGAPNPSDWLRTISGRNR